MNVVYLKKFPNGKVYVGITNNFERRMMEHIYESKKPKYPINHAIKKYPNHKTEIIFESENYDEVLQKEVSVIKIFKELGYELYNLTAGGEGFSGLIRTKSHSKKISKAMKGKNSGKKKSDKSIKKRKNTTKKQATVNLKNKTFTRSNFKNMCKSFGWKFENFSEQHEGWHTYPDNKRKRLYKYTKLKKGKEVIKTEEKNMLEKLKTNLFMRSDFKKTCKRYNWIFEDFSEEFIEIYKSPKGSKKKKYKYTKKS